MPAAGCRRQVALARRLGIDHVNLKPTIAPIPPMIAIRQLNPSIRRRSARAKGMEPIEDQTK
jgi:hypothetical protein